MHRLMRLGGCATGDGMGSPLCDDHLGDCGTGAVAGVERVKSGMRRARLQGRQIGRQRLDVDREQVVFDRRPGMSLTQVARKHSISRARVSFDGRNERHDIPDLPYLLPRMRHASGSVVSQTHFELQMSLSSAQEFPR